jgi:hypothetical protein
METWRRTQLAGAFLATFALLLLGLAYWRSAAWGAGLSAAMLAELVTGREAAIPLALVTGIPAWMVAATSIAQNLALAALLVPLAQQSVGALDRESFAARFMQGLHDAAVERLPKGRTAVALFAFMLVPFVANGPILAALIGVMAGLPARRIVAAVVPAVIITATVWTYSYAWLTDAMANVDERLALVPPVLAAFVTLAWLAAATRRSLSAPER